MSLIIKSNKTLRNVFGFALLILATASLVSFAGLKNVSQPLIIHYDFLKGIIDFLGEKRDVVKILIFGFLSVGTNFFLAEFIYERERFLSYIFAFASMLLSILILIAVSLIISVN